MEAPLRILILEDNPADAELVQFDLNEAGFVLTPKLVSSEKDFVRELQEFCPDLILSDYNLPQYNGALALAAALAICPDTPFILVSGVVTEDRAIEIITQGAKDYVLKTHRQQRLVPAVRRALAEAANRQARKRVEDELREAHRTLEEKVRIRTEELEAEIKARKKMEEVLHEREFFFKESQRAAFIGSYKTDFTTGFWESSEILDQIFGIDHRYERSVRGWLDIIHPDDRAIMNRYLREDVIAKRKPFNEEYRIIRNLNAEIRWVHGLGEVSFDSQGNVRSMIGTIQDITVRKKAEEALQESEKTARLLARENDLIAEVGRIIGSTLKIEEVYERFAEKVREAIPFDRMAISNINYKDYTRVTRYEKSTELFGERIGEVLSLSASVAEQIMHTKSSMFIDSGNREEMIRNYPSLTSVIQGAHSTMMIPLISKDEVIGLLAIHSRKINAYSESDRLLAEKMGNQIAGAIANAQLFLESKEAHEKLRESENQYRSLVNAVESMVLVDKDCRFLLTNDGFLAGFAAREDSVIGRKYDEFHNEENSRIFASAVKHVYETDTIYRDEWLGEKSGRWLLRTFSPVKGADGSRSGVTVVATDITERKQAEVERQNLQDRLQRSEKMEALGTLAGGVAHDLNNVLGILSGYSELLLELLPEGSQLNDYATNILKSSERAAAIIQDLLTLARRGVVVSKVMDLNGIVASLLLTPEFKTLKNHHPKVIFKTVLAKDLSAIEGSPVHLEKAVMNLASNALEAITDGGEVTIRTENRYLDQAVRGYEQVEEGDYAVLTVSDTGGGIPAADLEKIFEPFYTKKAMGRSGTGLGLAIVWGTVKDHNAYIDVQSFEGKGTTFTLYFPVTRKEIATDAQKMPFEQYMGQGESVLVVDDVEGQRRVASTLLTRLGYQVNAVSSGEEAVEYLKCNKADIVVLDMIMEPGIDGLETYQQILSFIPKQKAIIVSGFSETERVDMARSLGAGAYVKKPYSLEKIGVAIRDELNRK